MTILPNKNRGPAVARVLASGQLLTAAVHRIQARVATLARQQDSLRTLRRVTRVIASEGYGHALAAFISTNDFKKAAPQFPSLEGLSAVPVAASDRRVQAGLSQLQKIIAQEEQLVAEQISDAAAAIDDALQAAATQAIGFRELINVLEQRLENGVVSDDALQSAVVTAINADMRSDVLGHMIELVKTIDVPSYDAADEDLAEKIEGHLAAMVTAIGPSTGAAVDGFTITVDPAKIGAEYTPTEGSLADKGYTVEVVRQLLNRTEVLIDALVNLSEKRTALTDRLNSVAETVTSDNNTAVEERLDNTAETTDGDDTTTPGDEDPFALPDDADDSQTAPALVIDETQNNNPFEIPEETTTEDDPEASPDIGNAGVMNTKPRRGNASGLDLLFMESDNIPETESTDETTDESAGKPEELGDIAAEDLDDGDQGTENGRAAIGAFLSLLSLALQQATGAIASTVAVAADVVSLIDNVASTSNETPTTDDDDDDYGEVDSQID